jgi:hypothetical protein
VRKQAAVQCDGEWTSKVCVGGGGGCHARAADDANVGQRERASLEVIGTEKPLRAESLQAVELCGDLEH